MRPGFHVVIGAKETKLIEVGVGRYPRINVETGGVCHDEPLTHLALDSWLRSHQEQRQIYRHFAENHKNNSVDGNNGMENYVALYLAHVFSDWRSLGDVFTFEGIDCDSTLASQKGRLVALRRDVNGALHAGEVSFPLGEMQAPSSAARVLGFNAASAPEVLSWLKQEADTRAPFLFPNTHMGPDIIFCLQLQNKRLIWVAMQVKYISGAMPQANLEHAIRSVTPSAFFVNVSLLVKLCLPGIRIYVFLTKTPCHIDK